MLSPLSQARALLLAAVWLALTAPLAQAARPSESLLPNTTKGSFSSPDVNKLIDSFNKTQLGQLAQDPVMKPFTDDLRRQLEQRFQRLSDRIGLTIEDLRDVPSGEVCLALIQPAPKQGSLAVLADVTDRLDEANELLAKIDRNMQQKQATKRQQQLHGTNVITYTLKPEPGSKTAGQAVFFLNENMLLGCDNEPVALAILARFTGRHTDNLENLPAFRAVMDRVQEAAGELAPEGRWFCEPFGFVDAMRAIDTSRQRKGKDMVKILAGQGFTAVQGIGGYVNFYVDGGYEILHRTAIYAPPVADAVKDEKYLLAARMLRFPNGGVLDPQDWVPRELATYLSGNWEVDRAFEYAETLVDAIIGDEGVFKDVLRSIETDPNGPQVNLRKEFIAHLGTRCTMISDYEMPITPKSERVVMAIEATNAEALAKTIDKIMQSDPDAHRREVHGHVVWEIVDEQGELPTVEIEDVFDPIGAGSSQPVTEEKRKLPNSAVAVAHGHLFIATHMDFLTRVLAEKSQRESLARSADYQIVINELNKLVPVQSGRMFSRTDEEYRTTYELIRMGRMPEAESMMGRILNAMLGEGKEGELRRQRIDGKNLPEFEMVRRYFGPGGLAVHSEDGGWFMTGIILGKESQ